MLENMLAKAIQLAQSWMQPFALLMIDLDRFKEVNDTLGHEIGDRLLKEIARRLATITRDPEGVARFGGDEFCMIIPNATEHDAREAACQIVTVLDREIEIGPHQLLVGASVGIALYPQDGDTAQTLLQHADVAMYEAKRNRTGHAVYDAVSDQHSVRRLSLVRELRDAIDHGGLELYYQPKIAIATSEFTGVEALLRWTHPTHGRIPPDQIIAVAEQTGLIRPLTRWVLDAALGQCEAWREDGLNISVAVNLSANCILDQQLIDWIHVWFSRRTVPSSRLVLEVTEGAMMADPAKSVEVLLQFAKMGIGVSVDDYGTGFSSLAYLKRLPINELKIDRSFVMEMLSNENDAVIVRSTVELAHSLGLRVVAEGVEDAQVLDLLATLGCDYAQGYHVCRPVPAAELLTWWKTRYPEFVASRIPPPAPAPSAATPLRVIQR
jgi:diguanylate cyclase (GGDEF)-like protein